MNHSLLLIRNILHAPERPPCPNKMSTSSEDKGQQQTSATGTSQTPYLGPHSHSHGFTADCSQQNRLLWNLFAQGLDRILINLLASSQKVSIELPINFLLKKKKKDVSGPSMATGRATLLSEKDTDQSSLLLPSLPRSYGITESKHTSRTREKKGARYFRDFFLFLVRGTESTRGIHALAFRGGI